jgi:MYXO-CTERM domain-containing protein
LRPDKEMMMRKTLAAGVLAAGLALAPALDAVNAQGETTEESDDSGKLGLFGLAGLLGLAGLAGLKRRDRADTGRGYDTRTGSTTTR